MYACFYCFALRSRLASIGGATQIFIRVRFQELQEFAVSGDGYVESVATSYAMKQNHQQRDWLLIACLAQAIQLLTGFAIYAVAIDIIQVDLSKSMHFMANSPRLQNHPSSH